MADTVDAPTRSRIMAGIRGKHTKPEMIVRRFLHVRGFRFRLHGSHLPGRPDIILPKYCTVVFVNGCFWHHHEGCRFATTPSSNRKFWMQKFAGNKRRDRLKKAALRRLGWRVLTIWECNTSEKALAALERRILNR